MSILRCKEYVEIVPPSKIVCKFSKMGDYDAVPGQQNEDLTKNGPSCEVYDINNKYICVVLYSV